MNAAHVNETSVPPGVRAAVRVAVLQMTSGIDPAANAATIAEALGKAADEGAAMLFTPEMAGLLDRDRKRAAPHILPEASNPTLATLREAAAKHGTWLHVGSLPVRAERDGEGRFANRTFVIDPSGEIVARYDKIHMFDVDLATGESWRESAAYRPGEEVVTVDCPVGRLGLSICYDLRFPALFEELGRRSCDVIAIPAAFTVPTGKAHWHLMQRARAVEASAFVIAPAQTGRHEDGRETYGHSLVIDPWGQVILDMGEEAGLGFATLDMARLAEVRRQLPSLVNKRDIPTSRP
ncbi:Nitrilase/cyanide hydratase and apolipoprotein N-acyltransferase [Novosphingobium nitrogenifigens DSM 19370]|uniref:Nitrilase/cyanide hydratase and apolipoprotein N-acyltransferase n=1 Tax=Novosphingobium nitrogenifigens DSM 19370 TaxID=983920 RepID=F1Z9L5_9SPHN|nr:carbon-nitrogen hydrolase family protein [Novosphingobium nitrogenifigens]EGD58727.1 Nitrilase/cyanide hydratase and apolipoprotein N-acyltransferase [Novosphingobium nitrogenifigens DSM 19370]